MAVSHKPNVLRWPSATEGGLTGHEVRSDQDRSPGRISDLVEVTRHRTDVLVSFNDGRGRNGHDSADQRSSDGSWRRLTLRTSTIWPCYRAIPSSPFGREIQAQTLASHHRAGRLRTRRCYSDRDFRRHHARFNISQLNRRKSYLLRYDFSVTKEFDLS